MKRQNRLLSLLPYLMVALLAIGIAPVQASSQDEKPEIGSGVGEPYGGREWGASGRHGHHGPHADGKRGPGFGPGRMGPAGPGGRGGPGIERLHMALRNLDLSESQRVEIRTILEVDREEAMANHERIAALGDELEEQISTDPLDEQAVRAKASALASLRVEMAVLRARQMGEIRRHLTPEQLDRMEEMKAEHRAFREERRERFERRPRSQAGS